MAALPPAPAAASDVPPPQHVTVDGDTVVMESMSTGTHTGTFIHPSGGILAGNRTVEARSAHAIVVDGDRVTESGCTSTCSGP